MTTKDHTPVLKVENLQTSFFTYDGEVKAVDGVDFEVRENETLGIVGESGSGKSITSLSVMQLIQSPGEIIGGKIELNGDDLLQKSKAQFAKYRGNRLSMIFQEPMTSLNPVFTVGHQVAETVKIHKKMGKREAHQEVIRMLKLVGIPAPESRAKSYPHELSGGMRQRVMIAMALACEPELLIADEPTTALDVTIQAQILELIKRLQESTGMAVMIITHDLGVIAETADQVAVMYAGEVVEQADVKTLFNRPLHPYTQGLMNSIPRHDVDVDELEVIRGTVPSPAEMPSGCRFAQRCPYASEICNTHPSLAAPSNNIDGHTDAGAVRCWIYTDEWDAEGNPMKNEEVQQGS
ncbi:ABC transporter ATP-binding protein [Natribacillus halophilus]|uniref:Peptide/nickel transport system ATP-binding protein n=1 Tax=Natribacillus halophilus TaxID=549003 RepID=A0A1G8LEI1_9BACI|nr:ABC transporter ATP-binding protein [Natribacillus halophilus]SDI54122.1 peptide/nickel transport system ATP-binding protein [Natribacillus halophilus]